ncbi:hypothetical protein [Carnobacterium sp. ISL-102]
MSCLATDNSGSFWIGTNSMSKAVNSFSK